MLNIHKCIYFILAIALVDLSWASSDKRLCADPRCENAMSLGVSKLRYSASEKGMVSFNANSAIRVLSKSADPDKQLWEIEVDGKRGYAPKTFIKETKVLVPRANLVYVEPNDVQEPNADSTNIKATESTNLNNEIEPAATTTLSEPDGTDKNETVEASQHIFSEKSNSDGIESIPLREEIQTEPKSQILSNSDNYLKSVENIVLGDIKLNNLENHISTSQLTENSEQQVVNSQETQIKNSLNGEHAQQINIDNLQNDQVQENYMHPTLLSANEAVVPNGINENNNLFSESEIKQATLNNNVEQNMPKESESFAGDIGNNALGNHNVPTEGLQYAKLQTEDSVPEVSTENVKYAASDIPKPDESNVIISDPIKNDDIHIENVNIKQNESTENTKQVEPKDAEHMLENKLEANIVNVETLPLQNAAMASQLKYEAQNAVNVQEESTQGFEATLPDSSVNNMHPNDHSSEPVQLTESELTSETVATNVNQSQQDDLLINNFKNNKDIENVNIKQNEITENTKQFEPKDAEHTLENKFEANIVNVESQETLPLQNAAMESHLKYEAQNAVNVPEKSTQGFEATLPDSSLNNMHPNDHSIEPVKLTESELTSETVATNVNQSEQDHLLINNFKNNADKEIIYEGIEKDSASFVHEIKENIETNVPFNIIEPNQNLNSLNNIVQNVYLESNENTLEKNAAETNVNSENQQETLAAANQAIDSNLNYINNAIENTTQEFESAYSPTTAQAEFNPSADPYATDFNTQNSIDQSQTQTMEQTATINVTPLPLYNPTSSKDEDHNDLSTTIHYNAFDNDKEKPADIYQMNTEVQNHEVTQQSNIDSLHFTTSSPMHAQPEVPILNYDFITESPILSANENKYIDNELTGDDSHLHTAPTPAPALAPAQPVPANPFPYANSPSDTDHEPEGLFATIVTTVNNLLLNKKEGKYISNNIDVDKLQRNVFLRPKAAKNKYRQDRSASGESCNCEASQEGCEILKMPSDNLFDFFLVKILEARDLILCLTVTGATALAFVFGYYCFCNSSQESTLLSKLNMMERSLLALHTENGILKEDLVKTRHKLLSIEDNSFGSNDMVISLKKELDDVIMEKNKLQENVVSLEKELENAAEAGLELNKIVSELLSNQSGDESIISSVEELQKQLNEQQNTIYEINNKLSEKSRENSELQLMIAEQNARLSAQIAALQEDNDELDTEKTNLQTRMENLKIEFEQDITKALEGKNFEIKRLQSEITESKSKQEDSNMKLQTSLAKIEALEECLRTMKKNPGTNMSEVIDIVNIRGELLNMQKQNTILKERFESETDNTKMLENQLKVALEEVERLKQEFNQSERDKLEAQTRLEVLSNYFRDKETQLQKDLSLKETIWLKQQGETTSTVERLTAMQEEVQSLKSQNDSLRAEIEAQMAAYKAQTGTLENRAHETWLAARQSERKYEEARAEATALRRKLTALATSNANDSISDNLNSDINNAPSPILMEAPSSPMLGRLPPPPFLPPPFLGPPPPFMGIPPPFVQPGEMRPAPLGRLMSPPPPPTGSPQHPQHHARSGRYTPEHLVYDDYYDDEDDDELDHRRRRDSWHRNSYSPTRTYRSNSPSDSRYNYTADRDLISNYDTETDFSPPPSPRERRTRGSRSGSYKAYSPQPNTSPKEIQSDKKSLKGALSSSSEKSFISSQNERKGKSMV